MTVLASIDHTGRTCPQQLFSHARPKDRAVIARLATEIAVSPGRVLLHEGDPGRQFIVVNAGRARVTIGDTYLGCVEAGSFAGEMSLLTHEPCIATVTAVTPMHLLVFGRSEFRTLMDLELPGVTEQMLCTVADRLREVGTRLRREDMRT